MDEFVSQENKNLYNALTNQNGYTVDWPNECRNCEHRYSDKAKRRVVETFFERPMVDLLGITSEIIGEEIPGRYCCINNFRPIIRKKPGTEGEFGTRYHVLTDCLVVEEGLYEWYSPSWSVDDMDVLREAEMEISNPPPVFSLFDIVEPTFT